MYVPHTITTARVVVALKTFAAGMIRFNRASAVSIESAVVFFGSADCPDQKSDGLFVG